MVYLDKFSLPDRMREDNFILSYDSPRSSMTCFSNDVYPFGIFPNKEISEMRFDALTLIYGGNGSGKSTLLNVIAEKLNLESGAPLNYTPYFEDYLKLCDFRLAYGKNLPKESCFIRSDDVFDFMLDVRSINMGVDRKREQIFGDYLEKKYSDGFSLKSLDDYEELKERNKARRMTMSAYTNEKLPKNLRTNSNGESAFAYFTGKIGENALYILDEPENSLSPSMQLKLAKFIEDSVRFYGCQFIIATHSPFLLAMKDSLIYDLDSVPAGIKSWNELENVRVYFDFFHSHRNEFL